MDQRLSVGCFLYESIWMTITQIFKNRLYKRIDTLNSPNQTETTIKMKL